MLINTAGGLTGGDSLSFEAHAKAGSMLSLTTQAAERAYRAMPGQIAKIRSRIRVEADAMVYWLPQETILFEGCALDRNLQVDLAKDASFLMVEPLVFGRKAMGETLTDAGFSDRIEIRRDGELAYLDALKLNGDIASHLARPDVAAGAGAMASVVWMAPNAASYLAPIRKALPKTAGASMLQEDILVIRMLAEDSFLLRKSLVPILNLLTNNSLPRCWMT